MFKFSFNFSNSLRYFLDKDFVIQRSKNWFTLLSAFLVCFFVSTDSIAADFSPTLNNGYVLGTALWPQTGGGMTTAFS